MKEIETKYLMNLRWYSASNYLIALGEQIALWMYASRTFFWIALVLNVLSILGLSLEIIKAKKQAGITN